MNKTTYYVKSDVGSDENKGSEQNPLRTIAEAIRRDADNIILIHPTHKLSNITIETRKDAEAEIAKLISVDGTGN
jgi:hypothetical protein